MKKKFLFLTLAIGIFLLVGIAAFYYSSQDSSISISDLTAKFSSGFVSAVELEQAIPNSVFVENSDYKATFYPEVIEMYPYGENGDFVCKGYYQIRIEDYLLESAKLNLKDIYLEKDSDKSIMQNSFNFGKRYEYETLNKNVTCDIRVKDSINESLFDNNLCYQQENVSIEDLETKKIINSTINNIIRCDSIDGMTCIQFYQAVSYDYYEDEKWELVDHSRTINGEIQMPCEDIPKGGFKFNVGFDFLPLLDPVVVVGGSGFTSYTFNNTVLNGTHVILKNWSDSEKELPNSQTTDFWGINMTGNVLLMHLNNDSTLGENDTLIVDTSFNGNNGTLTGTGSLPISNGILNGAWDIDGNDYFNLGNDASFNPTGDLTVMAWVNRDTIGIGEYVITKHGVSASEAISSWGFRLGDSPTFVEFYVQNGSTRWAEFTANGLNDITNWHHVVVTHDGLNAILYVDGIYSQTISLAFTPQTSSGDVLVGFLGRGTTYYNGKLDEVAVWNRTLSAEEISDIYNRQAKTYGGGNNGTLLSNITDAGSNAQWNNISWVQEVNYTSGELLNNQAVESSPYFVRNLNMTDNVLLLHLNNDSSLGENDTLVVDTSFTGNNGSVIGAVVNTSGKFNGAYSFDGVNDDITVGNMNINATAYTVSLWAKRDTVAGAFDVLFGLSSGFRNSMWVYETGNIGYGDGNDGSGFSVWAVGWTDKTNFHHIVVTINETGTNKPVEIFFDGVSQGVDSSTIVTGGSWDDTRIGQFGAGGGFYFDGTIDEVAVWNRSLSTEEISDIYKRGFVRLNLSVRSCNDAVCSGESWTDINDSSPQNLQSYGISNNRYFQTNWSFESEDYDWTPKLYNVSIDYSLAENLTLDYPTDGDVLKSDFYTGEINVSTISNASCEINDSRWSLNYDNSIIFNFLNNTEIVDGSNSINVSCNNSFSTEVIFTFEIDNIPPSFTTIPDNATIEFGDSLSVTWNYFDLHFDKIIINDTSDFTMNQLNSTTSNLIGSSVGIGTYYLNVSMNDTSQQTGNYNSTIYKIIVKKRCNRWFVGNKSSGNYVFSVDCEGNTDIEGDLVVGKSLNVTNDITAGNVTASNYFGDASNLTFNDFTSGSIIFSNGSDLIEDNSNFFYDSINKRLGLGTNSLNQFLEVEGNATLHGNTLIKIKETSGLNGKTILLLQSTASSAIFKFQTLGNSKYWNWVLGSTGEMRYDSNNGTSKMYFYNDAKQYSIVASSVGVGIGAFIPTHELNVVGSANITKDLIVEGNFSGNQYYAEMWFHNDTVGNVTVLGEDVWNNVSVFDQGKNSQKLNGFTYSSSVLTTQIAGLYMVGSGHTFTGTVNNKYHCSIGLNGIVQNNCETHDRISSGSDVLSCGKPCYLDLNVGDDVTLMIMNEDSGGDSTTLSASVILLRIGD